ncbi:unnamed protein product [Linum tenue]|uniref:Cytochrome P450 n=1 Tax=Linum tenue TaxID=586396 RepID=A0AAV0NGW4_9ROSI|nr:unnamed protein product [Linum tenue]
MLPTLICQMVNFHDYLAERLIKHGGTVEMQGPWFSDMDSIITSDPANIRHIMSGNFRNYPKGPIMKEIFEPLGPNGIFAVDGESWVFQRKTLQLLISACRRYRLLMEKAAHDKLENGIFPVLDHLADNESKIVDLQDVFQRFTFDVICMTVLGYNPSSLNIDLQDVPLAKAFDDIDKGMFERHVVPETMWKLQRLLGLGAEKRLAVATERFDKFLYDFISSRREKIVRQQTRMDKEESVDLLTAHIEGETRKEDVVEYSTFKDDKLLRDMVINLLAAGRSTIAVALVWFFWSMANNPRVESKVLAELAANPPAAHHSDHSSCRRRQSRLYREEEVNRLVYLHATVAETLRLYTPTPMNHKWARETDVLPSGHRVRAKTRIFVSMYAMGRMKGMTYTTIFCLLFDYVGKTIGELYMIIKLN